VAPSMVNVYDGPRIATETDRHILIVGTPRDPNGKNGEFRRIAPAPPRSHPGNVPPPGVPQEEDGMVPVKEEPVDDEAPGLNIIRPYHD
jgi:hypothetical protein